MKCACEVTQTAAWESASALMLAADLDPTVPSLRRAARIRSMQQSVFVVGNKYIDGDLHFQSWTSTGNPAARLLKPASRT